MRQNVSNLWEHSFLPALMLVMMLSVACSRRPKEILSEKEMVSLMTDLKLAESYYNISPHEGISDNYELARSIMTAHGVSQERFDTTLSWYGHNLDEYVELYAKVDKELLKRRRRLMKDANSNGENQSGDELWYYSKNGIVSPHSSSNGWILSISNPDLDKGARLKWTMHLNENIDLAGNLGVEYADGSLELSTVNRGRNNQFELNLQTDTSKSVRRIFGTLRVKDRKNLPLFTDSIRLEKLPYDSMEYNNFRSQKRYAAPLRIQKKPNVQEDEKDTVAEKGNSSPGDSKESEASMFKSDSPLPGVRPVEREKQKPVGESLKPVESINGINATPRKK